jgi:hypothetical protein
MDQSLGPSLAGKKLFGKASNEAFANYIQQYLGLCISILDGGGLTGSSSLERA